MTVTKKLLALMAILLAFGLQTASADTLTLSVGNSALSGYTGPYAIVTISLAGSIASFNFTACDPTKLGCTGPNSFLLADGGSVGINVNGAFTYNNDGVASGQPQQGPDTPKLNVTNNPNEDGFGNFNFGFNLTNTSGEQDTFGSAVQTITFSLTGSWADAAHVLVPNSPQGTEAASHIGVLASGNGSFSATGFAGNGGTPTPDGGTTASLLGLALGLAGLMSRRIK